MSEIRFHLKKEAHGYLSNFYELPERVLIDGRNGSRASITFRLRSLSIRPRNSPILLYEVNARQDEWYFVLDFDTFNPNMVGLDWMRIGKVRDNLKRGFDIDVNEEEMELEPSVGPDGEQRRS